MNERIKELIKQCENPMWSPHDPISYDYEKFAHLIVQECIGRCEFVADMATITNIGEMARKTKATADSCATMIKEHFGVEE